MKTLINLAILLLALLITLLPACQKDDPKLKQRALEFYRNAKDFNSIKTFLTPVIQESIPENLGKNFAIAGIPMDLMGVPSEILAGLGPEAITIKKRGKWSQVNVTVDTPTGSIDVPTIWVRVEGEWYLYTGTNAEIDKYGKAPYFV